MQTARAFVQSQSLGLSHYSPAKCSHASSSVLQRQAAFKLGAAQILSGAASTSTAAALGVDPAQVPGRWTVGHVAMVEEVLISLGPGRYSLLLQLIMHRTTQPGYKLGRDERIFNRNLEDVSALCGLLLTLIHASADIASNAIDSAAAEALALALEGSDGEGEEGGEVAGKLPVGGAVQSPEAKKAKQKAKEQEVDARCGQLQPFLAVGARWMGG